MRRLEGKVPFRGGGFSPADNAAAAVATLCAVVALWQVAASVGLISTMFLPAPIAIGRAISVEVFDPQSGTLRAC